MLDGHPAVAAAAEYRELGFAIATKEAEFAETKSQIAALGKRISQPSNPKSSGTIADRSPADSRNTTEQCSTRESRS